MHPLRLALLNALGQNVEQAQRTISCGDAVLDLLNGILPPTAKKAGASQ